jgi:hypothetical protein
MRVAEDESQNVLRMALSRARIALERQLEGEMKGIRGGFGRFAKLN